MNPKMEFKAIFKRSYMPEDIMNEGKMIHKGVYNITGLHFWEGQKLTSISIDTEDHGEIQDIWIEDAPIKVIQCYEGDQE
jgi:hypothetical protein